MKKFLIPILLLILGSAGGVGVGKFLIAPEEDHQLVENPCGDVMDSEDGDVANHPPEEPAITTEGREYARLNNQFIVPVIRDARVTSLVVLSLEIEVESGTKENVFTHEPRLRDLFLQVLFDHANIGGFDGAFTASSNMRLLRDALRHAAVTQVGGGITDVLIMDIVRQDVAG